MAVVSQLAARFPHLFPRGQRTLVVLCCIASSKAHGRFLQEAQHYAVSDMERTGKPEAQGTRRSNMAH